LQGNSASNPATSSPQAFNSSSPPTPKDDISSLIGNKVNILNYIFEQFNNLNVYFHTALLLSEKHSAQIQWLQALLLETCYVKLQGNPEEAKYIVEPVAYHFTSK
jgi:hypothetical protein